MPYDPFDYGVAPSAAPSATFAPPASQLSAPPAVVGGSPDVTVAAATGSAPILTETGRLPRAVAAANVFGADPSDAVEGEYWVRSDLNEFRWREGGSTWKVAGTIV